MKTRTTSSRGTKRSIFFSMLLLLLVQSCGMLMDSRTSLERKEDRRDARAERHMTRALWLNPDLLQTGDSATFTFNETVAGDTVSGHALWIDTIGPNDSLLTVNRDLHRALLFLDSARMADNHFAEQIAYAQVRNAQFHMRKELCNLPPIAWDDSVCSGRAFITPTGLRYYHKRKPQYITKIVREKCKPCVVREAVREPSPPAPTRWGIWATAAIIGWLLFLAMVPLFLDERKKRRDAHAPDHRHQ